jgi:hypothetical protein
MYGSFSKKSTYFLIVALDSGFKRLSISVRYRNKPNPGNEILIKSSIDIPRVVISKPNVRIREVSFDVNLG